jgi:hypothetical protein
LANVITFFHKNKKERRKMNGKGKKKRKAAKIFLRRYAKYNPPIGLNLNGFFDLLYKNVR